MQQLAVPDERVMFGRANRSAAMMVAVEKQREELCVLTDEMHQPIDDAHEGI